jgi:hypothetical protein
MPLLMLLAFLLLAWARPGHADTYTCLDDKGAVLFTSGFSGIATWRCTVPVLNGARAAGTIRRDWTVQDVPKRADLKLYAATGQGVWTWTAPTVTANLDHYLLWRQAGAAPATVFAQIDGRTQKLILPMSTPDFGACFWFQSIAKVGASLPDQSNHICLDADGRLVPGV